jgi:hypothetical protein
MRFATDYVRYVIKGGPKFYAWMGALSLLILGMLYVFYLQNTDGLIVTGMTSQIHDGLYLANLVFLVGVAAGAVTIVFPAYVYHHEGMHKVTVLGEMLAISAVIMVMFFVFAHMGRPDRLWHMVPPFGIYSFSLDAGLGRAGAQRLPHPQRRGRLLVPLQPIHRQAGEPEDLHAAGLRVDRVGAVHPHRHGLPAGHQPGAADVVPQHDAHPLHRHGVCGRAGADHHRLPHHPQATRGSGSRTAPSSCWRPSSPGAWASRSSSPCRRSSSSSMRAPSTPMACTT